MTLEQKPYADDHWLRSEDVEMAFSAYMEQQSKTYSMIKNSFVRELLGDLSGKRFLDYGCGGGMFVVHAARQGAAEVVGVDALETALATARYFARQEGVERSCKFVHSAVFPGTAMYQRFDRILMKDVMEHVTDDEALLRAAAHAMVPGGKIVLSTQNSMSLNYLLEGTYRRRFVGDKQWCGWDETHLRFYTPLSLKKKLNRAGFGNVRWRSVYIVPHKLPAIPGTGKEFLRLDFLSWIDRFLGGVFPYNRLGWNLVVSAETSKLVKRRIPFEAPIEKELPVAPLLVTRESVDLP